MNKQPGTTFHVSIPVPDEEEEGKDHNKFERDFQELSTDYGTAYDNWCDAEEAVRKAKDDDSSFQAHFEKRKKFDELQSEFPSNLKTPVDAEYMKKILRRGRQNRRKRQQKAVQKDGSTTVTETTTHEETTPTITIKVPLMGNRFDQLKFNMADFGG